MAKLPPKIHAALSASLIALTTALVIHFEGLKYQAYPDITGVLTVCFGHTGPDIIPDKKYSHDECLALLAADLHKVKIAVDPLVQVPIQDHARAALYSFVYNVGIGAFTRSRLLKKLNQSDHFAACEEIKRWIYAGGQTWQGLIRRREIESALCHASYHH